MDNVKESRFLRRALVVAIFAIAMAYLEAAVVVYLHRALNIDPHSLFPLQDSKSLGGLGAIELGREAATIVMLAAVGWLAGTDWLARLAWMSVAFGIWDIGYYGWLWVFTGWPDGLGTYDLLFLIPVPWVAPVWAPMAVSLALITFGLLYPQRAGLGSKVQIRPRNFAALVVGGLVVIISFTLDASNILDGGTPSTFAWPVFVAGIALAIAGVAPLIGFDRRTD